MTNKELIAALESADGPSRGLMLEAFAALYPDDGTTDYDDRLFRFVAMLNAEAWESAALMIVPEGWSLDLFVRSKYHRAVMDDGEFDGEVEAINAATPAQAIVIAALKAGGEG